MQAKYAAVTKATDKSGTDFKLWGAEGSTREVVYTALWCSAIARTM